MGLRPETFDEVIGQSDVIKRLRISVQSALKRGEALGHLLVEGPPGLGKTTIAIAVQREMGVGIQIANGAGIGSAKGLLPYLMRMTEKDVLFIDEIHRLPIKLQESLYTVMEDFRIDVDDEDTFNIDLPPFTLIGATTEAGSLTAPLYDRFIFKYTLKLYYQQQGL